MPAPSSNRRRRRVSEHQLGMLYDLAKGKPRTATSLRDGIGHEYAVTTTHRPYPTTTEAGRRLNLRGLRNGYDDPKTATKAAKRGLERLAAWGLVRLFKAPHPEAGMAADEYWDDEIAYQKRHGFKDWELVPAAIRARNVKSIVPSGNRRALVVWAEITEEGRTFLAAQK